MVMSAKFDTSVAEAREAKEAELRKKELINKAITYGGSAVGVVALTLLLISVINKRKKRAGFDDSFNDLEDVLMAEDIINKAITEASNIEKAESFLGGNVNTYKLEEEIRDFAAKNPEQIRELIKVWLNE